MMFRLKLHWNHNHEKCSHFCPTIYLEIAVMQGYELLFPINWKNRRYVIRAKANSEQTWNVNIVFPVVSNNWKANVSSSLGFHLQYANFFTILKQFPVHKLCGNHFRSARFKQKRARTRKIIRNIPLKGKIMAVLQIKKSFKLNSQKASRLTHNCAIPDNITVCQSQVYLWSVV